MFNNITSYKEVKYLGTMNEKIQQIYILGEIQSYVNMPIIRNCLDKIRYVGIVYVQRMRKNRRLD